MQTRGGRIKVGQSSSGSRDVGCGKLLQPASPDPEAASRTAGRQPAESSWSTSSTGSGSSSSLSTTHPVTPRTGQNAARSRTQQATAPLPRFPPRVRQAAPLLCGRFRLLRPQQGFMMAIDSALSAGLADELQLDAKDLGAVLCRSALKSSRLRVPDERVGGSLAVLGLVW